MNLRKLFTINEQPFLFHASLCAMGMKIYENYYNVFYTSIINGSITGRRPMVKKK